MTYSKDGGVLAPELSASLPPDENLLQVRPQLSVEHTVEEEEADALRHTEEGGEVNIMK